MNEVMKAQGLMPVSVQDKLAMAECLAKSGLMPKNITTPQQVFVALQWGHELGLSPMVAINNVVVINGKPTLSTDIMHALIRANPEYGGCKWLCLSEEKAEVEITRNSHGISETFLGSFTIQQAQKAGLTGKDVWIKYPQRMLKHRALSYALRDAFPDVLSGIYTADEMDSAEMRNVTPVTSSPPNLNSSPVDPEAQIKTMQEKRKNAIADLSDILLRKNPDGIPWFTQDELDDVRDFIKKTGIHEQGLLVLLGKQAELEEKLKKREAEFKAIPWGPAETLTGAQAAEEAQFADDVPETPEPKESFGSESHLFGAKAGAA